MTAGVRADAQWRDVCALDDIWPGTGVCALVDGCQIAVFRLATPEGERLYALDNHDPWSGANVLSRGLVGNLGERRVVASPIYKQHFDLSTGECLEDAGMSIHSYRVRVTDGRVQLAA